MVREQLPYDVGGYTRIRRYIYRFQGQARNLVEISSIVTPVVGAKTK